MRKDSSSKNSKPGEQKKIPLSERLETRPSRETVHKEVIRVDPHEVDMDGDN